MRDLPDQRPDVYALLKHIHEYGRYFYQDWFVDMQYTVLATEGLITSVGSVNGNNYWKLTDAGKSRLVTHVMVESASWK